MAKCNNTLVAHINKVILQWIGFPDFQVIQQKKEEYRIKKEAALKTPKSEKDTTEENEGWSRNIFEITFHRKQRPKILSL